MVVDDDSPQEFEAPSTKDDESDPQTNKNDSNDIASNSIGPIKIKPPFPQQLRKKDYNANFKISWG